jgi:citrate lyase subunit beta / citryl-CoA lyase
VAFERSYLFVPGDRPARFAKALTSGADRVVLDLEDAVAPAVKEKAREEIVRWLRAVDDAARSRAVVRINGAEAPWHAGDVDALRAVAVTAMLPKSERADVVEAVHARTGAPVILLVETVAGLVHVRSIAACAGVKRIAFGSVDFCSDAGIEGDEEELDYVRSRLVIESRFAGLPAPIDGVTVVLDDEERIRRDVARARRFGFGAKLCIHPKQVAAVNAGFAPTADELAWARRVLAACANAAGRGAISVDGKLVDKPLIEKAQRLVAQGATPA